MYEILLVRRLSACTITVVAAALSAVLVGYTPTCRAQATDYQAPLVYKLNGAEERLELTTNSSRILTLDKNIPRVQVNNPELLAVTPLSATQVQISAKKAGVTQVNLWDDTGKIYSVDVLIYGDVRELEIALATQFPNSSIRVYRYSESLVLKGFIDQPENVSQIMQLASDYAPKVINNITVGGVQQVLLKVKVMEVSRTKLRELGVDWYFQNNSGFALNSITDILSFDSVGDVLTTNADTFSFGVFHGNSVFYGFLRALEQRNIAKTLAQPNIVAVSGRPAQFNVGGEFPIVIPQSLGTNSIEYKKYGTQIDFLPIVLGNGKIRLEVRPTISDIDATLTAFINGTVPTAAFGLPPALTLRQVDTAVEMQAGQTFALAGLVQVRDESEFKGLPYISDLPIIGVPFRRTENRQNEIELLIMVTPEFVDAMDPCDVACEGPGYGTTSPTNCQLFCAGHVEVPAHCNPISGPLACGECGQGSCGCNGGAAASGTESIISDGVPLPGGTGYDDANGPTPLPTPTGPPQRSVEPDSMTLPPAGEAEPLPPQALRQVRPSPAARTAARSSATEYTVPRPYSPTRPPVFVRNSTRPDNPTVEQEGSPAAPEAGTLIGPVGYDAE